MEEEFEAGSFQEQEEIPQREYHTIKLRFPKEMAYRVYDEFDRTEVTIQENGDLLVCAEMPEDAWLIGFLLSFGTQVEVISPVYLREFLARQAKLIYEKTNLDIRCQHYCGKLTDSSLG